MVSVMSRCAVFAEKSLLSCCAGRPKFRQLTRSVSVSAVVVRRMGRSSSRRSVTNDKRKIGVPAAVQIELLLGGPPGKGDSKVRHYFSKYVNSVFFFNA